MYLIMKKTIRPLLKEEEINLEKLRNVQLEILDHFKDFCDKNNLRFYLSCGTTLGAARHSGFIPWDDDIDVMMHREDYDKLLKLYKSSSEYFLQTPETDKNYHLHFAKMMKEGTAFVEYTTQHIDKKNDIFIDIFPIDKVPSSKFKFRFYYFILKSLDCRSRPKYFKIPGEKSRNIGIGYYLSRIMYFWCSRHKAAILRDNFMRKHSLKESDTAMHGLSFNRFPVSCVTGLTYLDFEGRKMPVPKGYKQYLTECFGDYMTPPPVEKRVPHHFVVEIKY